MSASSTEDDARTYGDAPAGDSTEQRDAEAVMLELLGQQLGGTLRKERFPLPDAGWLEVDGVSRDPAVLCEAWAHIGTAKSAQKNKVAVDALKLMYASRFFPNSPRKILLFADPLAAKHLTGRSWVAQLLRAEGIELHFRAATRRCSSRDCERPATPVPVSRVRLSYVVRKWSRSTPYRAARVSTSRKSRRRSPVSAFEIKDCGFPSRWPTSDCVRPAAVRASLRRARKRSSRSASPRMRSS